MTDPTQEIHNYVQATFLENRTDIALTESTNLIDEGILDSLGIFTVVSFLEEHFKIPVGYDEVTLDNFETVQAIASLVQAKRELARGA
jgi:acyl carrier protein